MNRVVLTGRLARRPKLMYTPCGVAVATCQLLVPRNGTRPPLDELAPPPTDEIECVAVRSLAVELNMWGDADCRVAVEGRLRRDAYPDATGREVVGLRVYLDAVEAVDTVPAEPPFPSRPKTEGAGS